MNGDGQDKKDEIFPIEALSDIISPLRLGTYLNASGHDANRALRLYLWNAQIGEAFHIPIQSVEVGLRNRVSDGLATAYGGEWWQCPAYLEVAGEKPREAIEMVLRRLNSQNKELSTGQVVAGLSFGFWVSMLHRRYNPTIWSQQLRRAFPHLPAGITRDTLYLDVKSIASLRNRIWHHEPIFRRDLSQDHATCLKVVHWLCPAKARWIRPYCRFSALIRQKP